MGALEGAAALACDQYISLSEQNIIDCSGRDTYDTTEWCYIHIISYSECANIQAILSGAAIDSVTVHLNGGLY